MPAHGSRINRRRFLSGLAAAPLAATFQPALGAERPEPSLRAAAAGRGIEIGSAYNGGRPDIEALIAHHCDVLTPGNAVKPGEFAPDGLRAARSQAMDEIALFCRRAGLKLHGHTLFWHQSLPEWLDRPTWAEATRAHRRFIRLVMTRYREAISWDVINEPFADMADGYRGTPLLQKFGDDFLAFLFETARDAAPYTKLVLNDYALSCGAPFCARKRGTVLDTIDRLFDRGVPVDVVGIQAHLAPDYPVIETDLSRFLTELEDRGIEVYVSEMDVNDIGLPDDIETRDRLVADIYRDYLEVVLSHRNVTRLAFWGLSDSAHWIVEGYAPSRRATGRPRPALFDEALMPKPAFDAVMDVLRGLEPRG